MISIGQLAGRALTALRRRWLAVLGILFAWLAVDGFLLGYLNAFYPAFWLTLLRGVLQSVDPAWLRSDWFQILLLLPQHYLRDIVRAVFVVLLLRSLLAPMPGAGTGERSGIVIPVLLILVFEIAWTTILHPIDQSFTLTITRATTSGTVDAAAMGYVSALVNGLIFACYALAMSKLCFVYPHATARSALRSGLSWRETKGLSAKLFLLLVAIPVPFFVLHTLLTALYFRFGALLETAQQMSLVFLMLNSAREVPTAIVTLAVIAAAYVAATGHAAGAIPGSERTPGQLAEAFD